MTVSNPKIPTKCICCGSDVLSLGEIPPVMIFAGQKLARPMHGGELLQCRTCGIEFRYPQPKKELLDRLYRNGKSDHWKSDDSRRADWLNAKNWIKDNISQDATLLDVGCFDGGFLATLSKNYRLHGLEIHEAASQRARNSGINILGADFKDIERSELQFDVITSFDVIEHTQNPLEFMLRLANATKRGGTIIVSTGNSDAPSWKILGAKYWYCTIGEHLVFINPAWCQWVAKKLDLDIVSVTTFSHLDAPLAKKLVDLIKNLIFSASPSIFSLLRRLGMGGKEYRQNVEMLRSPPSWMTAEDHFLCVFKKR